MNDEIIEAFKGIDCEISKLTIKRYDPEIFGNYVVEVQLNGKIILITKDRGQFFLDYIKSAQELLHLKDEYPEMQDCVFQLGCKLAILKNNKFLE